MKLTKKDREELQNIGTAGEISQRIHAYTAAVTRMSTKRDELVQQFPKHWVALYEDEVICTGHSLADLFRLCDERKFKRDDLVIQFLDTEKQILIL